ncbi:kinesin-like protein Klp61F isoform X1 [Trichogramma pretiosum]|uniref:kinesin-like protein Klp61F isoform X1 n=1 Tax=Trichogramma pretiosum TaxID=7493 RepID=UPI0006C96E0B|nr:kinesin-like protein Klp61F isoform X1 [Trichogramma pretiosum]
MNDTRNKKEKNQHIQVFARVRPLNNAEKTSKSPVVVDVPSNKEIIVKERPQDKLTKKFTFDKTFGPLSKQIDVYNAVVSPLLDEVLAGYNCTVFAYGQTGTGKTFTMEGACNDPSLHWQTDSAAGIIPRALSHLFDELRMLEAQEYSVRVSFLELYNEELFDLLSPNDDASKIRIFEDASRKGAIIIHGLEEVTVHNKSEVYKILEKGSEKRQTAATLMNAHSSRSHTVFSITVHIKENTVDGEELLKTGKLNLVDLAGSENVGRSGAVDRRAREAGNINQSLLTLGRVITALVERAPHVPYRESKLTRLLQESLGGRTKTSIIATISPASINIEETLSTLDYAHRAKNITNRPEINQKLSKKALLKEYTEEIERLRRDLLATRERNGVYLAQENYNEMQSTIEAQGKEIEEKINHIKALEETMRDKEKIFEDMKVEFETTTHTLVKTKEKLISTKNDLITTKTELHETTYDRDLHKHLVEKHVSTEQELLNQAKTLLNVAETATTDTVKLHEKIDRKKRVEEENENLGQQFKHKMMNRFESMQKDLNSYGEELSSFCSSLKTQIESVANHQNNVINVTLNHIGNDLVQQEKVISNNLVTSTHSLHDEYHSWILTQVEKTTDVTQQERWALQNIVNKISPKIRELVENKVTENLRALHNETALKLMNLSNTVKKSMDDYCRDLLEDRDNLTKEIQDLKKTVQVAVESQNRVVNNEQAFAKMFTDLKLQFDNTWKKYETLSGDNKYNHSTVINKFQEIQAQSDKIIEINNEKYSNNLSKEKAIENQIENQANQIRKEVSTALEYNWNLAESSIVQSIGVINQLEGDINASRQALSSFKDTTESCAKDLQLKFDQEKEAILSTAQDYHQMISNASEKHTRFMEEQRTVTLNNLGAMNSKVDDEVSTSSDWQNKLSSGLHETYGTIDKFISEDLHHDVPTGTTPARRDFHFPRSLVATSPHDRIIKRFREITKPHEYSDTEDDNTIIEMSSPALNGRNSVISTTSPMPTKINHVTTSTPRSASKLRIPVMYSSNNCSLIKSASTSDLSLAAKAQLDSTTMSESGVGKVRDNKENGDDEFVKPDKKPKRLSKTRSLNRRVLGSYN